MTLRLLKGFALLVGERRITLSASAQQLLAFLALQDRPRTRTYVARSLWPEATTTRANANLRSSLWRALRNEPELILASSQEMALASFIDVDIHASVARAHQLLDRTCSCEDILNRRTREDLSCDLLPEWSDNEWVLLEKEQYHQLRLYALEAMADRLTGAGRYGEAVAAGLAAVQAEPLRESAHRALIDAHLAAGNRAAAQDQYQRCRRVLLDELGLEPTESLRRALAPAPNAR
ncbi:transcriptional regulator [Actinophytocola xinjiangensis]|uniref:Transcriptional regulator n=1 Tax=Actinophytocola xinjiangensis TaxID=485602 RepID=A0A7Z0WLH9_9PSEU|nr:BTAD domain-containing putative transcriptional regulator [Actinophytocola xinjiangensis]OLF10200.1 transcriptional regulator [Actinophytocola xinjiangensis]